MQNIALLAVARGDKPADRVLRNGRLVNVLSGDIEEADIALCGDRIAGVGAGYAGHEEVDLQGAFVAPGLIDAHVHIESSLCLPAQYAAAVVPRGVTTVAADPHEIANVAGVDGVRFMAECSRNLPLQVVLMAPSAVPATHMETSGAELSAEDLAGLLEEGTVHGLAELMNFPGTVQGDPEVLAKIDAFSGRPRDGHAPALSGQPLNAYAAAGPGSDHECATVEEAAEKLARGFYVLIREATNARNLHTLLPLVNERNNRRICFCTDDRMPSDLIEQGSIDHILREAISFGLEPVTAFRIATLNSAEWFGLHDRGAIAPGRRADLMVFDDLSAPAATRVYAGGRLWAEDGKLLHERSLTQAYVPAAVSSSVRVAWDAFDLRIPATGARVRVIGSLQDQVLTEERLLAPLIEDGQAVADPARDILKMAVVDRHTASNATGLGFIQGFGLHRGAIAGTVAHDHHNLVVIGADDESMTTAARIVAEMGGGLAVAEGRQALEALPLPVAGLMSERSLGEVRIRYDSLLDAAHELGSSIRDPFMAMSFMALEVIPKLKLTDQGLVDVEAFSFVDLFVEE
ncbi:MAG: adenine deaminase [Caldilineaceae bacterium]|nr:adenine deaminase [Caldilineaceae bacterium]